MKMVEAKDIQLRRYPGIKPFSTEENEIFFGRDADIAALNKLILIRQMIVLYGKSGYGKSSLINAGIIPKLKQEESIIYFSVRFNHYSEKEKNLNQTPSETIKQKLSENIQIEHSNILDNLVPHNNSFWYLLKQNQLKHKNADYIIFFDQFEELFSYPKEQITQFSEELSELLYEKLPFIYKKRINELEKINPISDEDYEFLNHKPEVKVIFSIRSDRMALLNVLKDHHPSILQNSYELHALSANDAKSAIIEPARLPQNIGFITPDFEFTDKAIDKIISSIANPQDGKIEAATLQIVCRFVEENLLKETKSNTIDDEELGNITDVFQQYYQGILDKLSVTEKEQAQKLIEDELIEGNRRNPLSENYIKSKFGISENLLLALEESSLLKKERDGRGTIIYEVSHDSLIGAINKIAEDRRRHEEEKKRLNLQLEIAEGRRRAEELEALKNKAELRYKVAIWIFALLLLVAGSAVFFGIRSKNLSTNNKELTQKREEDSIKIVNMTNQKEKLDREIKAKKLDLAKQQEYINIAMNTADSITGNLNVLQFNYNYDKARKYLDDADEYISLKNKTSAIKALNNADKLLQTKDSLPIKEEIKRKDLLNIIKKKKNDLN
jgi:hypothetical protein